jgi:hypothetical protein
MHLQHVLAEFGGHLGIVANSKAGEPSRQQVGERAANDIWGATGQKRANLPH